MQRILESYVAVMKLRKHSLNMGNIVKMLVATALILFIPAPKLKHFLNLTIEMNKPDSEPLKEDNRTDTISFCKRTPEVLILGVKKCGTITLSKFLDYHPMIAATGEVPFFETDKSYAKGWENYIMKMPAAR